MATANSRFMVNDVDRSIPFHTESFGLTLVLHPASTLRCWIKAIYAGRKQWIDRVRVTETSHQVTLTTP